VRQLALLAILGSWAGLSAQQAGAPPLSVAVKPIAPPATPLPPEGESASVARFAFIAYGDTRGTSEAGVPSDGRVLHARHSEIVDAMLVKIRDAAATPFPIKFVVQSGDAVLRGPNAAMWNVSFSPIIERLTRTGNVPYFFAVGNHDVTGMPPGDPGRALGLHNTLAAMSALIPPEGSPRRLSGYPTYAFGYGNLFAIAIDTNIVSDRTQLAWVANQLEHLDRARYPHVLAFFHHPAFTSGPHGGPTLEPQSRALRELYLPLFRRHHVRLTIAGHDHLLDHWVERYKDGGASYRRDDIVTGGGGAPIYTYAGEPDLDAYLASGTSQNVRVTHLAKPGPTQNDNPHHFLIVKVDGDGLSLEVVATGGKRFTPYGGRATVELND